MPDCIDLSQIGGAFLQPVFNLPIASSLNIGQIIQPVNILQSFSKLQGMQFLNGLPMAVSMQSVLSNLQGLGFSPTPILNNAATMLNGLLTANGFSNGLFGFLNTTQLSALIGSNGAAFLASLRDVFNGNFTNTMKALNYLIDMVQTISYRLPSNADGGVDLNTTLEFPPTFNGGLGQFGFMSPLLTAYGDGVALDQVCANMIIVLTELRGHAFNFKNGALNSDTDLANMQTLMTQMQSAGILQDPTIVGPDGVVSMTNMLEIQNTFVR